jgi:DNA-binding XRE family transcriptional regulator
MCLRSQHAPLCVIRKILITPKPSMAPPRAINNVCIVCLCLCSVANLILRYVHPTYIIVKPVIDKFVHRMYLKTMHLDRYMEITGLDDEEVAKRIGVGRVTVSRIRRHKVRPDWSTIKQLRRLSRGAVTASDFEVLEVD